MLSGTVINYYYHCKRQCWLFYHRINLEDNSEDVRIGKVLHEIKSEGQEEVRFENISLDKITADYVIEIKKSDADVAAARAQLLYYLKKLKNKGIIRKGRLEFIEKNKQSKKQMIILLEEAEEQEMKELESQVIKLIKLESPPIAELQPKCKKCAYYEYCFI